MFLCSVVTLTNPSSSASGLISPLSSLSERRLATDVEKGISFMKGAFRSTCYVGLIRTVGTLEKSSSSVFSFFSIFSRFSSSSVFQEEALSIVNLSCSSSLCLPTFTHTLSSTSTKCLLLKSSSSWPQLSFSSFSS